jgi:hypothetical protein
LTYRPSLWIRSGCRRRWRRRFTGVANNDLQICAYNQAGGSTGNVTLAFSNGTTETYVYQDTKSAIGYEPATATASSTFTANNLATSNAASLVCADYP